MPDNAGEDVTPEAFKAWLEKLSGHSDSAGKADRKAGKITEPPPDGHRRHRTRHGRVLAPWLIGRP